MGLLGGLVNAFLEGVAEASGENNFAAKPTGSFCSNCGGKLSNSAKFCHSCGTKTAAVNFNNGENESERLPGGKEKASRGHTEQKQTEATTNFTIKYQIIGRNGVVMNGIRYANVKAKNLYEAKNAFTFKFTDSGVTKYKIVGVVRN